jgi:predicted DNA-binding transcriptional regulator AlpA
MKNLILSPISVTELQEIIHATVVQALAGQNIKTTDELIDRSELMEITGINSYTTVIKYEKIGIFKPRRLGKKLLYNRSEVLEAIRKFQRA